jgi:cytoskeletal protein CcmA (bactofilin family)
MLAATTPIAAFSLRYPTIGADMWNRERSPQDEGARQQPLTSVPTSPGRQLEERRVVAWVGKSVVFKGELISSEDMTIDGRVEGSIELRDHSLTIGPDAHVRANIVAKTVTVLGAVIGTITARDTVELRETGSVDGDIISPRLAMADGAALQGRVDTGKHAVDQNELATRRWNRSL